jgi:hypothetical protein
MVIILLTTFPALAEVEKLRGKAVNSDGALLFYEEHTVRYENGRIVAMNSVYYDADLKKIGELVSDFAQGSQVGNYDFKDERRLYNDGAIVMSEKILIYRKKNPQADMQRKFLQRESDQIVGQGFHLFILDNIDALKKGQVINAKLVLPAQMDQFNVRVYKKNLQEGRLRVRIEMDNWFLRLFAPHVDADYDIHTRRLLSYQGVSVVAGESGKSVPVSVFYSYGPSDLLSSYPIKTVMNGQAPD